jgi:hypothetical protein
MYAISVHELPQNSLFDSFTASRHSCERRHDGQDADAAISRQGITGKPRLIPDSSASAAVFTRLTHQPFPSQPAHHQPFLPAQPRAELSRQAPAVVSHDGLQRLFVRPYGRDMRSAIPSRWSFSRTGCLGPLLARYCFLREAAELPP